MLDTRGNPDFEGFQGVDGESEAVGPPESIDLDDEKLDLLSSSEVETELAISASFATAGGELEGVPTSTPVVTPIHSPDWHAAAGANSVSRHRGIFEPATSLTVKPAYNLRSSGMPSYDPEEIKAIANLALEKVKHIIDLAKKDVERAEAMFSDGEDNDIL